MKRTFRYPLYPNQHEQTVLESWIHNCQQLYNGAIQHRRDAWARQRISISYNTQTAQLADLRAQDTEWAAIPSDVARSALHRVKRAFDAFFRRVKRGEKPGYPRFRARERYNSFSVDRARLDGDRVLLPKLGAVRLKLYRPMQGKILDVTIRRETCGRWYVCFACDLGEAPGKVTVRPDRMAGIDVGINTFAAITDGTEVELVSNPRYFRKGEQLLAARQRRLATKKQGSNSRRRARTLVAKTHRHIHNQRLDHARKLACALYARYDFIAHEDLAISRMIHGNLAKSIHDAAWGIFLHALTCKAEEAGKWCVPVDPYRTSQICSACGSLVPKERSERVHRCACGVELDRDVNAALNVLALGRSAAAVGPKSHTK